MYDSYYRQMDPVIQEERVLEMQTENDRFMEIEWIV